MREHDLIMNIATAFPRSDRQKNALFECDSEIIQIGDSLWGLSMDEFSPEEDLFTSENPVRLGKNLAIATLSDLLAAGAEPQFFMHSVSLPVNVERQFVDGVMEGIRTILDSLNCAMCGGDVGTADPWRFCGFGMGPIRSPKPLTHLLPREPQTLWITGTLGDANLAALQNTPTPAFELRNREADVIRSYATACIDTSGGLLDALWLFHEQNPALRFDIRLNEVPIAEDVIQAANTMGFPVESALLGGAGEYELLFAVPETSVPRLNSNLHSIGATCIGSTRQDAKPGIHLHRNDGLQRLMVEPPPCPRAAATIQDHVQDVLTMARQLFVLSEQP
jgi:thiamine-monophosphate kinase